MDKDLGKQIQTLMKENKALKLTAAIQGDIVRVSGAKIDNLQAAIAMIREQIKVPFSFENFRDK